VGLRCKDGICEYREEDTDIAGDISTNFPMDQTRMMKMKELTQYSDKQKDNAKSEA
jgi:hypothetical protein